MFCHVEGSERSQAVATEKGNENSKTNYVEGEEVVSAC